MHESLHLNINTFDAIVIAVVALSTIVAFFRGFIRELLSLGAWVGAGFITLYFFPATADLMKHHVKDERVAAGVGALATYISALIGISIVNSVIIRYVKTGMEVGLLDNMLGLMFGLLRGVFIVSLGFLILSAAISQDNPPEWLSHSITRPYVQQGADALIALAPQYLSHMEDVVKKSKKEIDADTPPARESKVREQGYKSDMRKDMDRLFNATGSQDNSNR